MDVIISSDDIDSADTNEKQEKENNEAPRQPFDHCVLSSVVGLQDYVTSGNGSSVALSHIRLIL